MPTPLARSGALLLAVCAITTFAACGEDDEDARGGTGQTDAAKLTITAGDAGFTVRDSLEAGLTEIALVNRTQQPREAQLVRVEGDHDAAEVLRIISKEGGPTPSWLHAAGGVTGVAPGATARVRQVLGPGTYYVTDTGGDGPGRSAKFEVTGEDTGADVPATAGVLTAREYAFTVEGLRPGRNVVRFENTGNQLHHAVLLPVTDPSASTADIARSLRASLATSKLPVDRNGVVGTAVLDPGEAQQVTLQLKAGPWVAVCFISDRTGGEPHLAKGQITKFRVG